MIKRISCLTAFILGILIQVTLAEIPRTISYQGILQNANGEVVADGDYALRFTLSTSATNSSIIWEETHENVAVQGGVFNVVLGSIKPIDVPFDLPYYLGISVNGGSELSPRIELTASAYSFRAQSVADSSVDGQSIADGQVVRSINSLSDRVQLVAGDNVKITQDDSSLTISAQTGAGGSGDITAVTAGDGLTGGGESGDVELAIPEKGVTQDMLADSTITGKKIADGEVLRSLKIGPINSFFPVLTDTATLRFGSNLFLDAEGGPDGGFLLSALADGNSLDAPDGSPRNAVVVDDDGNVGVGTSAPASKLSVAGTIESTTGGVKFPDGTVQTTAASGETGDGHSLDAADGDPVDAVFVDNDGNVGIGTSNPGSRLNLQSSGTEIGLRMKVGNSWTAELRQTNSSVLSLINGGSERLTITAGGLLGVRTTSPLTVTHIINEDIGLALGALRNDDLIVEAQDAALGLYSSEQGSAASAIAFGLTDQGAIVDKWGIVRETTSGGSGLRFTYGTTDNYFNNPTLMYLDDSGNVGVGTGTPDVKLQVTNGTDVTSSVGGYIMTGELSSLNVALDNNEIMARNNGSVAQLTLNADGGNVILGGPNGGNIGIGTTNPQAKLDVRGNTSISGNTTVTGEVRRPSTGNANMVPICYGNVASDGKINGGSGNFSVSVTNDNAYEITIDGESIFFEDYIVMVTPAGVTAPTSFSSISDKLLVRIGGTFGNVLNTFSFVVYKP